MINSLENMGALLKRTTRKFAIQHGGLLNFLRSLMTAAVLPLIKGLVTTLAKSVSIPLGLSAEMSPTDAAI